MGKPKRKETPAPAEARTGALFSNQCQVTSHGADSIRQLWVCWMASALAWDSGGVCPPFIRVDEAQNVSS